MTSVGGKIAALSAFIDSSYPEEILYTELHLRRRTDKLIEEVGEVMEVVSGSSGENPRKGVTHQLDEILPELLDVAVTALGAYESLTGNYGLSVMDLNEHMDKLLARVGINIEED